MYQLKSRVRYSETGEDGCLSLTGLINYFQDCSTFHSEDCHMGLAYLLEQRKAWMLSSWRLLIERYPALGEEITVGTWHCGRKGIYGYRNFVLFDREDHLLAKADSAWFLLNLDTGTPCRVMPEDVEGYGVPGEPLPLKRTPGKIDLSGTRACGEKITVSPYHIDTNHHVNNAQYIAFAREAAGISFPIAELRADYRRAAVLGDVIELRTDRRTDERPAEVTVGLFNAQGEPYAAVWMKAKNV